MIHDQFLDSEDDAEATSFQSPRNHKPRCNRGANTVSAPHIVKFRLGWQFTNLDILSIRYAMHHAAQFMQRYASAHSSKNTSPLYSDL